MDEIHTSSALTSRELEVLQQLALGLRTEQIAHRLNIAGVTVEFHIRNARVKLIAATREQLVAKAVSAGLVSAQPLDED